MVALLAALVLSPSRLLPEPFLSTELRPILPVAHLSGIRPTSVARGGSWRPGGFVRVSYFYKFPKGDGPTHKDFVSEPGFAEEPSRFGMNPSVRVGRIQDGIRQTVSVAQLDEGMQWKWAGMVGPATIVSVSEFPLEGVPIPRWHNVDVLSNPPLPPGCPPDFGFLKGAQLSRIDSEPIIPRIPRLIVGMTVKLTSVRQASELRELALKEISGEEWKQGVSKVALSLTRRKDGYGLQSIVIANVGTPSPSCLSEITLNYTFADPENAPRIEG